MGMPPNTFGSIRRLPSGRYQARYRPLHSAHITAPHTFSTPEAARAWLDALEAEVLADREAQNLEAIPRLAQEHRTQAHPTRMAAPHHA